MWKNMDNIVKLLKLKNCKWQFCNLKPVQCLLTQNGKLKTFIVDYL